MKTKLLTAAGAVLGAGLYLSAYWLVGNELPRSRCPEALFVVAESLACAVVIGMAFYLACTWDKK